MTARIRTDRSAAHQDPSADRVGSVRSPGWLLVCLFNVLCALGGSVQAQDPPAADAGGPTYWARDFSFDAVNVQTVLSRLRWFGVDVPFDTQGTVSVDATVWIPFGALANPNRYLFEGTLTSPRFRVESLVLTNAELRFRLDDGTLHISHVTGNLIDPVDQTPAGKIAAQGSAQLLPLGPLRFTLQLQQVDLPYVLRRIDAGDLDMSGQVTGQVQMENQVATADVWPRWSGLGQIRVDAFQWQDRPPIQMMAQQVRIQQGRITSDQLAIQSPTMRLSGAGTVDTTEDTGYRLNVTGDAVPLGELVQWGLGGAPPARTSGRLGVRLTIAGGLTPFTWQADGEIRAAQARLLGLEIGPFAHRLQAAANRTELRLLEDAAEEITAAAPLQSLTARYSVTDDAWRLSELAAELWGGQIQGSALWVTAPQGEHRADLSWRNLAIDVPLHDPGDPPRQLHADTSGSVQWSVPVDQLDHPAAHHLTATAELQGLTLGGRPIGRLTARATAADAAWRATGRGTLFGGDADFQLSAQAAPNAHWADVFAQTGQAAGGSAPAGSAAGGSAAGGSAAGGAGIAGAAVGADAMGEGSYRLRIAGATVPIAELLGRPTAEDPTAGGAGDPEDDDRDEGPEDQNAQDAADDAPARSDPAGPLGLQTLRLDLAVAGGLFPFDFDAQGIVRSGPVQIAGLPLGPLAHRFSVGAQRLRLQALPDADPTAAIQSLETDYAIDPDALRLSRLQAQLWGGQVSGNLIWRTDAAAQHSAELQWQELNLRGRFPLAADRPQRIGLITSGRLQWAAAAAALDQPAAHRLQAVVDVDAVTIEDRRVASDFRVTVSASQNQWSAGGQGQLLQRPLALQLQAALPAATTWEQLHAGWGARPAAAGAAGRAGADQAGDQAGDQAAGDRRAGGDAGSDGRYALRLQTASFPVVQAVSLLGGQHQPPDATLAMDLDLTVTGRLLPVSWQISGTARSAETLIAGLDFGPLAHRLELGPQSIQLQPLPNAPPTSAIGQLTAAYAIAADAWQLNQLQAQLWGGRVSGRGQWSNGGDQQHHAQIRWSDLTAQGQWMILGDDPSRLQARTSGQLQWSVPADSVARPAAHRLGASVEVTQITLNGAPIGDLSTTVTADDARWSIRGEGRLLGGPAEVQLRTTLPPDMEWHQLADQTTDGSLGITGMLEIGPVPADRLLALWQPPDDAQRWSGQVQIDWELVPTDPGSPRTSRLQLVIDSLQYAQQRLTDRLAARVEIIGDQIVVQSLQGTYAGGRIRAAGRWGLGASASQLAVQLTGIDASRAVLLVSPSLAESIVGRVTGRLLMSDGDAFSVTGALEIRDAVMATIPLGDVRTSVAARLTLPSLRWWIRLRDIRGRIARGRLQGRATLQSHTGASDHFDLDSHWEMDGIDFQKLLDELGAGARTIGRGKLTGTLTLSGRRIRSAAELRGELRASLGGSEATAIPGLAASQNYLGVFSLRNTRIESGSLHGQIRHGEFQIQQLWLVADQLRVWGEGDIVLASGRLDIDMVAATGDFDRANPLLLSLASQLALEATLPVSLLLRANELLSDRVIRLQLYGTYRHPRVRIHPVATLGENAARFFLRSITPRFSP